MKQILKKIIKLDVALRSRDSRLTLDFFGLMAKNQYITSKHGGTLINVLPYFNNLIFLAHYNRLH